MSFDVEPAPVRRRGPRIPAIVVLAAGVAVVAFAVVTADPGGTAPVAGSVASPGASVAEVARVAPTTGAPTATGGATTRAAPFPSTRGRRLPANLECHAISDAICDAVATASLAVLPADAPAVAAIDAWASILCGDSLDCPPQRLARSEPLGSAVVSFAGGNQAWVNVVEPSAIAAGNGSTDAPIAWIVRWLP
jgi:hypothetical protein